MRRIQPFPLHQEVGGSDPFCGEVLGKSLDACLTFFKFPEGEWISLRTTNIIERLNEFRRRTKPVRVAEGRKDSRASFLRIFDILKWCFYHKNPKVSASRMPENESKPNDKIGNLLN